MRQEQQVRTGGNSLLKVSEVRAVGGADLQEVCPRSAQHVGDAEAPANLDQLRTRDGNLLTPRECCKNEEQSCSIIIDDQSRFRACQARR